ncbi:MAG: hypothetical protein PSV17_00360 [Methylotenera sp.]|uniref:FimV/HubP family polar landmark protein n=1 Tax=Methylotenera sp. TaxID=2051956 RepID=UPI00248A0BDE|nr:FimV/HubP family polar landmark protein [Methylotenera sp.]MDI1307868.1 hypothetical protein [Methylotenera sp.]
MRKSKIKQISLAVCLALLPLSSYAAGLGKLNVSSGIGEPLKAEIELLSVTPEELSTLAASIASEDAYAQQGLPRLGIHNNIKVDIAKSADGSPILKIRSSQPVSDPYLDMLIQVDWATGRLQREYTVLLDPPGYKPESSASAPVTLPSAGGASSQSTSSAEATQPTTQKSKKQKRPAPPAVQQESASDSVVKNEQELTIKRGDTLSSVAKEVQVEGVSLDQMLVGLYENNKEAFVKGNMNRLKVGQIIKVPSKEALTSIDSQQAKKIIKLHSVNWNTYRNALAGNVEASSAIAEAEQKQSVSGKIATAEDKAAPVSSEPKDVVKLSAVDKNNAESFKNDAKSAQAKIIALQEETTARENALKEANDKTVALEKQIADLQKLIAMKNQSMADIQNSLEATTKAPESVDASTENAKPEVAIVEDAKPEVKKPVVSLPAIAPVTEELSFFAGLINSVDLALLGVAGGLAVLLGGGWVFLRNKRRKDLDSFERGILTSGGLRANTVFGNTTGNASMSDTSFLTDFAQSADGSMIDTHDVDPIAEAEVYMAYGRDAQAEEILKDAISKEPKRYELHLKLLEMYGARKDTSAFETIAGELYTTLGADDPTWAKVAAIGIEMEPNNPLYNVSKPVAVNTLVVENLAATDFSNIEIKEDADLDFSFNDDVVANDLVDADEASSAVMQSFTEAQNIDSDISFDLGTLDDSLQDNTPEDGAEEVTRSMSSVVEEDIPEASNKDAESNLMDFDLGDFVKESAPTIEEESVSETLVPEMTDNSLEFNVPKISNLNESVNLAESSDLIDSHEDSSTDFAMNFNLPSEADELPQENSAVSDSIEEISFDFDSIASADADADSEELQASEITFDFSSINDPVPTTEEVEAKSDEFEANMFDLSEIDLSLADAESEVFENPISNNAPFAAEEMPESPDINIKLDLVAAYIDMDDKEGARELLEEVLKEGGTQQQLRAQELLNSLG